MSQLCGFLPPHKPEPVTIERLEEALDRLAEWMVRLGADGPRLLPIYDRLERELATMRAVEDRMAAVRERAGQSKDRKQARSPRATG